MADTEVFKSIESATMMLEELAKAFSDLESHSHINSSIPNKVKWDEIKEYFQSLEISLKDKLDEVKAKEKVLEEKQSVARTLIAEKEAVVSAKELASLARLQELRDSAVSAIADARHKHKVESPEPIDTKVSKGQKVGTSFDDKNAPSRASKGKNPDEAPGEVQPQLKELCEKMDAKGLLMYIIDMKNRIRFTTALREELPLALKYATEPASLVLESLECFYPLDQPSSKGNEDDTLQGMRRSCLLLMESASLLFCSTEPGVNYLLSSEIKQKATEIANKWKPKLASLNLDASNSLEAQAYLQLLATFSIAPENDEDELCKLIVAVSSCRQAPEFCRSLGLAHRVPDVVEELVQKGRQIDAVRLIQSFELTDRFPPVPLLKAYSAHSKDIDKSIGELGALRTVIKCIEEYKLQDEYPCEPLQKQVARLEIARANKKRIRNATTRFHSKKHRRSGSYRPPRRYPPATDVRQRPPPPPPPAAVNHRGAYAGGMATTTRRPYDASPAYEAPARSAYGQQAPSPRSYHYPDQRAPTAAYGSISSSFRSYPTSGLHADEGISSAAHGSILSSYGSYPNYPNTGFRAAPNSYVNYMGTEPPRPPPPLQQPTSSTYGSYSGVGYQPPHQSYM